MIIKGTKEESAVIRWVQKALSKDSERPVLGSLLVQKESIVACDSHRLHAAQRPEALVDIDEGMYTGKVPAGQFIAELETEDNGTYPRYQDRVPNGEPVFEIALDPKYLIEALSYFQTPGIRFRFFGPDKPMEIIGKSKSDGSMYVLLMPRRLTDADHDSHWRPDQDRE
ncbi:hypothetical protein LCGC14_2144370 [marine sediment metagenome]|uniref:DNA polymerase III beta sliding clamp C-terminal domain-containing protein n=1 Tax=marine sediment metagenome TaxID=412755 RepID=A0A0F9GAF0_9ZZZZ